jgi:hypothetical protein
MFISAVIPSAVEGSNELPCVTPRDLSTALRFAQDGYVPRASSNLELRGKARQNLQPVFVTTTTSS